MGRRSSKLVAVVFATLVAPLAAIAQGPTGSVTTSPLHQAPALGIPALLLLAVVLAGLAMYRLHVASGPTVGLVLMVAVILSAGLGSAGIFNNITISGAECMQQTVSPFSPLDPTILTSNCPNLIQITDIEVSCAPVAPSAPTETPPSLPICMIGQTLVNGQACRLPLCSG